MWTLFVGVYAGLSIGAFFAATFALSQWLVRQQVSALYALPVLLLLAVGARSLAFVGQGLGKGQLEELRGFLDDVIAQGEAPDSLPRHSGIRAVRPVERGETERPSERDAAPQQPNVKESFGSGG